MEDSSRDLQNDHLNSLVPDVPRSTGAVFVAACLAAGVRGHRGAGASRRRSRPRWTGWTEATSRSATFPAYYAVPKTGGKRPVVLVVAEIWGAARAHQGCRAAGVARDGLFRGGETNLTFRIGGAVEDGGQSSKCWPASNQLADEAGVSRPRRGARLGEQASSRAANTEKASRSPASLPRAGAWCGCTARNQKGEASMPASPGTALFNSTPPAMPQARPTSAGNLNAPVLGALYGRRRPGYSARGG